MMNFFDNSKKTIIAGPITIGDDDPVTKYRTESDGRTFWAYNGMEVFYEDERMYHALDEICRLNKEHVSMINVRDSITFWVKSRINGVSASIAGAEYANIEIVKLLDKYIPKTEK